MPWNYRIVRDRDADGSTYFSIRTAHYDNGAAMPHSIAETPAYAVGSDTGELRNEMMWMVIGLMKPVIDAATMLETDDLARDVLISQLKEAGLPEIADGIAQGIVTAGGDAARGSVERSEIEPDPTNGRDAPHDD